MKILKNERFFLGGIPLSKYNLKNDNQDIKITQTPTIEKCLREIALSITLAWTTLISSPISNGKTMIVEYVAEQVGKRLIKIQCSDHMDSKVGENLRVDFEGFSVLFYSGSLRNISMYG